MGGQVHPLCIKAEKCWEAIKVHPIVTAGVCCKGMAVHLFLLTNSFCFTHHNSCSQELSLINPLHTNLTVAKTISRGTWHTTQGPLNESYFSLSALSFKFGCNGSLRHCKWVKAILFFSAWTGGNLTVPSDSLPYLSILCFLISPYSPSHRTGRWGEPSRATGGTDVDSCLASSFL